MSRDYDITPADGDHEVYEVDGNRRHSTPMDATAKAKSKFAEEHDVEFRHVTGRKLFDSPKHGKAWVACYVTKEHL